MSDDFPVKSRSDDDVKLLAKKARAFFEIGSDRPVDVLACLGRDQVWTVNGIKRLKFIVRPDNEMGADDATTTHEKDTVRIECKESVRNLALMGEGRARNTLAHELGHAVMHNGVGMARRSAGNKTINWIKPFESAEHQVKVFAPAFLIDDRVADSLTGAEEISIEFGVSLTSAKIYFKGVLESKSRRASADRIRQIAEEFRAQTRPSDSKMHYLDLACTSCGNHTVFPVGAKFMCQSCDGVIDRYPDGD